VSGRGLWGLIPIVEPEHHKKYFEFIQKAFASMGIIIDESCKDVSRLRGYSYDPEAYFNHDAKPLNKFYSRPKAVYPKTHFKGNTGDFETERIEYCINEISARKIDITARYNDWFALGCSFASLGEQGRQYFHAVSQNYPGYDPHETDEQFTKCLKTSSTKNLATFFAMCRDAGVHFKDAAPIVEPAPAKPKPLLSISTDDICHIQWINQTGKKFDNLQIVWLKTATENFEVLYNEQGYPVTEYSKTIAQVETEFKKKFTPGLLDGEACFLMKIDKP
ncbi:MAG: PriCT-2 domain-containing protein, partial [Chitinophagaceae bacterium]|nr:PriCT-2 domain-containing protein [Chitinophagaceae bacterium]